MYLMNSNLTPFQIDYTPEKHHKWSEKGAGIALLKINFELLIILRLVLRYIQQILPLASQMPILDSQETPEELEEDRKAEEEEKAMQADGLIGKGTSMDI